MVQTMNRPAGADRKSPVGTRFREMLDALPAAVYTTDAEGRITHFNRACVAFSGRTPTLGSDHWCITWKLYYSDGRPMPHEECPMAIALKTGQSVRGVEAIAERPDGSRIWFTPYPTPFFDDEGNVTGGINMLVDITDQKNARDALRQSDERYRQTLSLMPAAVYSCDASGLITFFNEEAARLWGRAPEVGERFCGSHELVRHDGTVVPPEKCPMAVALRQGTAFRDEELNIRRPDGSMVTVLVNIDPVRNGHGEIVGAINAFHDVSAIKEAERATARLAAIVESSDDAIISKDLHGIIRSWNRGAERLFGYTADETIGRPVTMLMPSERAKEEPGILDRIGRGESVNHYETVRRRKDGSSIDISLTVSPIRDAQGRIIGASKIARDITARKQAEVVLREQRTRLEIALEESRAAMRVKDQFVATVSHELRTPLTPAIMRIGMLLEMKGLPDRARSSLEVVRRNLETETRMINDLLDLSRIAARKLELYKTECDLHAVVRRAAEVCGPQAQANKLTLSLELKAVRRAIKGDAGRLEQVFWNLIQNAVKFTPEGGRIRVGSRNSAKAILVTIEDTGRGINPGILDGIFEPFAQGSREAENGSRGLGLGLTIAKDIVARHEGSIRAASRGLGRGSKFTVCLPCTP